MRAHEVVELIGDILEVVWLRARLDLVCRLGGGGDLVAEGRQVFVSYIFRGAVLRVFLNDGDFLQALVELVPNVEPLFVFFTGRLADDYVTLVEEEVVSVVKIIGRRE
mmetsp:Transcript_8528/g.13141  ORF Transcript_8528/g.13141 Transcript_8528/m.13141 type:complete len:108 (+) Transcript_8528:1280-1603(+)